MIEQIFNILVDLDNMERTRIINNVINRLEKDRVEKLAKAKAEVYKLEVLDR